MWCGSPQVSTLVCSALSTRFHPDNVTAAWQRASLLPSINKQLADLDRIQTESLKGKRRAKRGGAGGAEGGSEGQTKRARSGYNVALLIACGLAMEDPEVKALLAQLPLPKAKAGANGEQPKAALPIAVRSKAWSQLPEDVKQQLLAPVNSLW